MQLAPSMAMMATVYSVDWHTASTTTETTATLTARHTWLVDFICSMTVHIWYLWTWGDEEEKSRNRVVDQGFRALLSKERVSVISTCISRELVRNTDSRVYSPICRLRISVHVARGCVWCVWVCTGAWVHAFPHMHLEARHWHLVSFIYLLIPYFWDRV